MSLPDAVASTIFVIAMTAFLLFVVFMTFAPKATGRRLDRLIAPKRKAVASTPVLPLPDWVSAPLDVDLPMTRDGLWDARETVKRLDPAYAMLLDSIVPLPPKPEVIVMTMKDVHRANAEAKAAEAKEQAEEMAVRALETAQERLALTAARLAKMEKAKAAEAAEAKRLADKQKAIEAKRVRPKMVPVYATIHTADGGYHQIVSHYEPEEPAPLPAPERRSEDSCECARCGVIWAWTDGHHCSE
jgi:hypothetical protein